MFEKYVYEICKLNKKEICQCVIIHEAYGDSHFVVMQLTQKDCFQNCATSILAKP